MLIMAAMALLTGGMAAFHYLNGKAKTKLDTAEDKLAIVRVEGVIDWSENIVGWIEEVRDNDSVLGVLLRVDCPGGAVAPSQEIYDAVYDLAEKKPVVCSMGTVAASGGYYVSAPAHTIVANPSTLTGSIGVIMELSNLEGLFDKLGIKYQSLTSGKLKDAGSPYRPMTKEDREYFMSLLADIHEQFLSDVAQARGMETDALRPLADGRALTGNQALQAGLVDKIGSFSDALDELRGMCNAPADITIVEQPTPEEPLLSQILGHININIKTDLTPNGQLHLR